MKIWKKNVIAAAVLVTVCAGIYVNWLYTEEQTAAELTDTIDTEKVMGDDTLLLEGDQAVLSDSEYTTTSSDYFAAVRLSRQEARDSAVELLQEAMSYSDSTKAAESSASLEDIIQTADLFRAGAPQQPLGAGSGVDIAGKHIFGIVQNHPGIIGEDDLYISTLFPNQVGIVLHIVHQCKGMQILTEQLAVALQRQYIRIGIDLGLIQLVQRNQLIAHFIRRIAEHQNHLLGASGDTPQADSKPVPGQNGEDHADRLAAQLSADILGNGIYAGVVALSTGHHRFGDRHHIPVAHGIAFAFGCLQHALHNNIYQIITLPDNGAANASGYSSDFSFHTVTSFPGRGISQAG